MTGFEPEMVFIAHSHPSAGMTRIRFRGLKRAFASLSPLDYKVWGTPLSAATFVK